MPLFDHLELQARELAGESDDWCLFSVSCMPLTGDTIYYEVKGAIAPIATRGVRKGHRNWPLRYTTTERTFCITVEKQAEWEKAWEQRTGKCADCVGCGKTVASAGVGGTTYRTCSKCQGSGDAKETK